MRFSLLTGSRTVHMAAADYVNRFSAGVIGKYGYSRIGIAASATVGDSIKMLRSKYPQMFILGDGMDLSGANAKNASYGFSELGRGAVVCVGNSVTCAWKEEEYQGMDFVQAAWKPPGRIGGSWTDISSFAEPSCTHQLAP